MALSIKKSEARIAVGNLWMVFDGSGEHDDRGYTSSTVTLLALNREEDPVPVLEPDVGEAMTLRLIRPPVFLSDPGSAELESFAEFESRLTFLGI